MSEGEEFRKTAETHWQFIETLLNETKRDNDSVENQYYRGRLLHYLYIEAMVHGYKHGKQIYDHENHDEGNERIQSMVEKL
jgi:hypothetical protein